MFDCIRRVDLQLEWQQAVKESAKLLLNRDFIEDFYIDHMIEFIKE